jgi:uncharacterized protein (TIGR03435 family)
MRVGAIGGNFTASGITPQELIQIAYHVQYSQLAGAPEWLKSARYDIDAQVDKAEDDQLRRLTEDQRGVINQQLLQGLLADQFKLKVHQEPRELPVYEMAVAEAGSKLQKGDNKLGLMHMGMGQLSSTGTPLSLLAAQLSMRLGRTVVDKTGLSGNYAYSLRWSPDSDEQARLQAGHEPMESSEASSSSVPPLMVAIQEQLGLTLQPQTDRVQVLVIDRIEQPAQE